MSDIREVKSKAETMIIIGMSFGDTITDMLRNLISGWKQGGEKTIKNLVKELEGKKFTNEGNFVLHAKHERTGLSEIAVSSTELKEFQKLCKSYGVDFHFQKRPVNLEQLFHEKQAGKTLSAHQESIVNAFSIHDDKNAVRLKQDGALITFKERDLPIMERILDKMEEKTYGIEQRKLRAKRIVNQKKQKEAAKTKTKSKTEDIAQNK